MILQVKDGNFGYKEDIQILKNINFTLEENKIMTILGQNGIGKTTLLKCITGIMNWSSGNVLINGKKIEKHEDIIKYIGYVPQSHKMSFPYTIRDIVVMGRTKHMNRFAKPSKIDFDKADEAIERVGISHLCNRSCNELSGGQLQLAFLARALSTEPEILIMDEPESHLDFKNQFLMLQLIKKLAKESGISCIINTHYPDHALCISDKTLIMGKDGYIFGDVKDIITEKNIKKYFEVEAKFLHVEYKEEDFNGFIVVDSCI